MKSRAKTLIFIGIFVACLALVSLVLVLTQPKTDKEDNPAANNSQTIPIVTHERDEVASMKITNASGEYTITQNAKGFTITELEGLKQNTTTMGAAGNCITKINAQALAEENASDLAKYGLEDSKLAFGRQQRLRKACRQQGCLRGAFKLIKILLQLKGKLYQPYSQGGNNQRQHRADHRPFKGGAQGLGLRHSF